MRSSAVSSWLAKASLPVFSAWTMGAAFCTYFCMYAFRKPFAVGTYEGSVELPFVAEMDLKILFVISQVLGYATSKFLGIKIVSEMPPARRAIAIVTFIGLAELALLLMAILPTPWNALALFLNGLPLGMIWGLVFGFLEGRTVSDILGAGLCASFIVASGFVKTVGKWLIDAGVAEVWMPFTTGLIFTAPLLLFIWMLAQVPTPDANDERLRTKRIPMDRQARWTFFSRHATGLSLVILGYLLLSAYRDFRDNFARELWDALGYEDAPSIMTTAEVPIAVVSLLAIGLIVRIKDNQKALWLIHGLMFAGAALTGVATLLFQAEILGPATWMICVGMGLYLGYVPINCVLFDRLIAAVGQAATAGFLIYVADASGYAGSVALMLYKNFGSPDLSWLSFFIQASYVMSVGCMLLFGASALWFQRHTLSINKAELSRP